MSMPTMNRQSAARHTSVTSAKPKARIKAKSSAKLWVICCEETEVARQISDAVMAWQLPNVRSLSSESLSSLSHPTAAQQPFCEAVAEAAYAIFITSYEQPSSNIRISPLNIAKPDSSPPNSPVELLLAIHHLHGQSPHSWWLQLPTAEVRAQRVQPISVQESVAQALNQIGIFIRNYQLAMPYGEGAAPVAINNLPKASADYAVSPDRAPDRALR
ncbi:MAG: hypothetical protein WBA76_07880 [Phormidesmis sp.]